MLNKSILAAAVKYVRTSWFYGKLVYTTTMRAKPFSTDFAIIWNLSKPNLIKGWIKDSYQNYKLPKTRIRNAPF